MYWQCVVLASTLLLLSPFLIPHTCWHIRSDRLLPTLPTYTDVLTSDYIPRSPPHILCTDGFDAFLEAGSCFDATTAQNVRRFVYSAGNSLDPAEAYRLFRGRCVFAPFCRSRCGAEHACPCLLMLGWKCSSAGGHTSKDYYYISHLSACVEPALTLTSRGARNCCMITGTRPSSQCSRRRGCSERMPVQPPC
jgi:hypothetical protein